MRVAVAVKFRVKRGREKQQGEYFRKFGYSDFREIGEMQKGKTELEAGAKSLVATVFDKPRCIAEVVNGRAWAYFRTPTGIHVAQKVDLEQEDPENPCAWLKKLVPIQEGSVRESVSKLMQQRKRCSTFKALFSLNPNDPVPRVNFPIDGLENWKKSPVDLLNTGGLWVGIIKR